jgi:hypothetical protein
MISRFKCPGGREGEGTEEVDGRAGSPMGFHSLACLQDLPSGAAGLTE